MKVFLCLVIALFMAGCINSDLSKNSITPKPRIDAGHGHIAVIDSGGNVYSQGRNDYGQLGAGHNDYTGTREEVSKKIDGMVIALGDNHTVCLHENGKVWTWGDNFSGQLGNGKNEYSDEPVEVEKIGNIVHISAGGTSSYAIDENGKVWAWGDNFFGQLGNGSYDNSNIPVKISGLSNIVEIDAGASYCFAIDEDGSVWGWGNNSYGQLGNGTQISEKVPVKIEKLTDIKVISARVSHSIAITKNGTVLIWGNNILGNLGVKDSDGNIDASPYILIPTAVTGITDAEDAAAGGTEMEVFSLVLTAKGNVYSWGGNFSSQLGDGTSIVKYEPTLIEGLSGIEEIAAGPNFTLFLRNDYSVLGCGKDEHGQLNSNGEIMNEPKTVMKLDIVK